MLFRSANTSQTRHRIASITRVFTGAAILKLWEQEKIGLEDPVATFFPDFPRGDVITVGHLLAHTSGLVDPNAEGPAVSELLSQEISIADLVARFRDKPLKFEPGESYAYSDSDYILLAAIIEKVSGQSYGDFLKEAIFDPAGMSNSGEYRSQALDSLATAYTPQDGGQPMKTDTFHWSALCGWGNVYSTTQDLYQWHQALMKDSVLSKDSRAVLGNMLRSFGHTDGLSSGMVRFPSRDTVIIVLGNFDPSVSALCGEIASRVLSSEEVELSDKQLKSLAGDYEGDGYTFKLVVDGKQLFAEAEDGGRSRVVPLNQGDYLIDGLVTAFGRDEWGRVTGIVAKDLQEVLGDGIIAVKVQ